MKKLIIYSNLILFTSQNTNLSKNQILINPVSPTLPNFQPIVDNSGGTSGTGNNALGLPKLSSYQLPTYTIFPPVRLPSFQEWKQQSSGKKEGKEVENREKWEFPLLRPATDNHENPQLPKINIPQQQPTGLFFKDKRGRFNYADSSCGAKVLKTNENAKSKSNILKKDKDYYLMNECNYQEKFIEIELCDTIWVTSVILGNLELYSSNFKDIKISVRASYSLEEGGWNEISTYTANNWKQLQRFNTVLDKTTKKSFVKYLRIDLISHYGNEFYCPITQVIVHGITMLEDHMGKGKNPQVFEEEEEATMIDENASKTASSASENEVSTTNDLNTPPPSPTQNEDPIPPKPVELPKEPSTFSTLTEDILKHHQVPTDHYTTTTMPSFKQSSNSSQNPIGSTHTPITDQITQNTTSESKSSEPITKPTESAFDESNELYNLSLNTFNNQHFSFKPLPPLSRPIAYCPLNGTHPEPFTEAPKHIQTLTPPPSSTASAPPPTSQTNESEILTESGYEDDDDDDDHGDNVFRSITQKLTKLEKEFTLLQDYLQLQTAEFNRALLEFQGDQRDQLIKSYLFLNSTLNRELYSLRRLQSEGWSRLMEVIDIVGERSKNEVNSLKEELNTIQFIIKWLVLGEFILILGLVLIYIIFNWLKSDSHINSNSQASTVCKSDLKFKIKQS